MRHDIPAGGRDARDSCVGPESGSLAPDAIDPICVCAPRRRARPPHESEPGPAPYEKGASRARPVNTRPGSPAPVVHTPLSDSRSQIGCPNSSHNLARLTREPRKRKGPARPAPRLRARPQSSRSFHGADSWPADRRLRLRSPPNPPVSLRLLRTRAPCYGADSWSRPAVSGSTRYSISRSRSSSSTLGGGAGGGSSASISTPR